VDSVITVPTIETDERKTPRWLIEELQYVWDFGLDAAAIKSNAIVPNYLGPDHSDPDRRDALVAPWYFYLDPRRRKVVWCNPPYSRGMIARFCEKATEEANLFGVTTVMLLPGDTSTGYFHDYVLPNRHHFLKRRLKFEGAPLSAGGKLSPAKFGSVLVVFQPERSWSR
jgi:phage N-6-adenine-methyltransferase